MTTMSIVQLHLKSNLTWRSLTNSFCARSACSRFIPHWLFKDIKGLARMFFQVIRIQSSDLFKESKGLFLCLEYVMHLLVNLWNFNLETLQITFPQELSTGSLPNFRKTEWNIISHWFTYPFFSNHFQISKLDMSVTTECSLFWKGVR